MEISIDDFQKCEIQTGIILSAERMEKSNKLLLLKVDTGDREHRTILSGIAKHYAPEDLVGEKCCVLTNLAPREMMGYTSQGMLLCVTDSFENLSLLISKKDMGVGARIS